MEDTAKAFRLILAALRKRGEALTVARGLLVMTGRLSGMGPVEDSPLIADIDAALSPSQEDEK